MADKGLGVTASAAPTDKVDNEERVNSIGETVLRQLTRDESVVDVLDDIRRYLMLMAGVAPARDPLTHSAKVQVQGTVPISGALTTVTTLTTMANQTNLGGLPAQNEQYGHGAIASALLVQRAVSG